MDPRHLSANAVLRVTPSVAEPTELTIAVARGRLWGYPARTSPQER